jgi:hypothetical protein
MHLPFLIGFPRRTSASGGTAKRKTTGSRATGGLKVSLKA